MSRVGLILGGGGVTGAAFHLGSLFSLQLATGWDPNRSEVVIGTSSGGMVAAMVRSDRLAIDALVGDVSGADELAAMLRERIFRRTRARGVGRWVRHGLVPGIRRPGVSFALGSPARYTTDGIVEWMHDMLGPAASAWPNRPTIVPAYQLEARDRVAFGTDRSPDVSLAEAVAASSAVPLVFQPVTLQGRRYVDGGVASGTSADLVLGSVAPLDLLVVIAPMASEESRPGAKLYEGVIDRLGGDALDGEIAVVSAAWPDMDIVILRPDAAVLEVARPNPLDPTAALPVFLRTLRSMRARLAEPQIWRLLAHHLGTTRKRLPWRRRLSFTR